MRSNDLRDQNRRSWDAAVPAHFSHHRDLAAYLRGGGLTVFPEERELLGELAGRSLAHLMCNTGQDTLSLASLGARATGVDSSAAAIAIARALAAETGIPARFEQMDVYDWLDQEAGAARRYERVLCSYGAVCWLSDLGAWARGIAAVLAPAGRFALVDFHPASNMLDRSWRLAHPYPAGGRVLALPGIGDYVAESAGGLAPDGFVEGTSGFQNPEPCYVFQWGVGEVVTALAAAGLRILALREYLFTNGERPFARMRELPGRRMAPPADVPAIPLMYGVAASLV